MATVTLSATPSLYSPVSAPIWFRFNSSSSNVTDFKYLFNIFKNDELTGATTSLGQYKVPPRPSVGDGIFDVHRILQSQVSYDINHTISTSTVAPNSITKYGLSYGFEYNPGVDFVRTFSSTYSTLGLSFSVAHPFQVGDLLLINKDDKTTNPQYDGTASIIGLIGTSSIVTDNPFLTIVTNETGSIDSYQRVTGTTSGYFAFNGTRQYAQQGFDFGSTYLVTCTGSNIGATYALTNYAFDTLPPGSFYDESAKVVELNDYETLSYLVDNSKSSINFIQYMFYTDNSGSPALNTTQYVTYSVNSNYHRVDVPAGPLNINNMPGFDQSIWDQVQYYTVSVNGTWDVPGRPTNNGRYSGLKKFKVKDNDPFANCSSKYPKIRLCWLNRLGGIDYFSFNFKSKNAIATEKVIFKRNLDWNYTVGQREDTVLTQTAMEIWNISSDFISQNESNWLKELFTSPEVYYLSGTTKIPIIIGDSSYEVKTSVNDHLIAVTLTYRMASNVNLQSS